jgi:regulator of nucleoside diphosphate kinase
MATPEIVLSTHDRDRLATLVHMRAGDADEAVELLDQEIRRARVAPPHEVPPDVAAMGARLLYLDHEDGREHEALLAWPGAEGDDPSGLSVLTLTGCALLGLACGQTIHWRTPQGANVHVTLLKVLSRPRRLWFSQPPPRRRGLRGLLRPR